MLERLAAFLGVILLLALVLGVLQILKARGRVRLQGSNAGASVVEGENSPVLLVFTAPYCSICRRKQRPAVEEVTLDFGKALAVREIDVTVQPELADQFGVATVPSSFVIDVDGKVQATNHGLASAERLRRQLQEVLAPEIREQMR
ncbi:thioredoxin family protein [Chloroflexota bacterium]